MVLNDSINRKKAISLHKHVKFNGFSIHGWVVSAQLWQADVNTLFKEF